MVGVVVGGTVVVGARVVGVVLGGTVVVGASVVGVVVTGARQMVCWSALTATRSSYSDGLPGGWSIPNHHTH